MSYQIRRIDPYWIAHPIVLALAVGGALLSCVGILIEQRGSAGPVSGSTLVILGALVAGAAILLAAKPAISATFGALGLIGFSFSFFFLPDLQMAGQSFGRKLLAAALAGLMYMPLMDALVLAAAFFYNFFGAVLGGGIALDIEQAGPEGD